MSKIVDKTELELQRAQQKAERREERKEWLAFKKKEFIKNLNIVKQLVIRSVKVQYRNSVIGILWTVLNPLLNMLVMFLVFSTIFDKSGGFATDVEKATYPLYLLCGNIVFGMMRTATSQALPSIVQNRGLLTKNKMSYNVFPLSYTLSAVVNFGFSLIALLGVMLFVWLFNGQAVFSFNIFLVLVALPALFLFCYGLSLILSALYTFFRDIKHFYNVFLTLWMYITPIFYGASIFAPTGEGGFGLKDFMRIVIHANPMYYFVEYFRDVIYRCSAHRAELDKLIAEGKPYVEEIWNDLSTLPSSGETFALYAIGIGTTLLGAIFFMATKRKFIYNI